MKILNFGSLNLDYTYRLDHFVRPGETEASFSRTIACGGKGLNQSIALAKCGAPVIHAGAVGKSDGLILIDTLNSAGVDTSLILQLEDVPSGSAFIQVVPSGENAIVLDGGANQAIHEAYAEEVLSHFEEGDWLLLQNEISCIPWIMRRAHEIGMNIVLNPSPMNASVFQMPLEMVDLFIANEHEASRLSCHAQNTAAELQRRYPTAAALITLGGAGSMYIQDGKTISQDAFRVDAVDTTGAGDTFTGFFLGSLVKGEDVQEAMRIAAAAAALSVTKKGASGSIPSLSEVMAFLL